MDAPLPNARRPSVETPRDEPQDAQTTTTSTTAPPQTPSSLPPAQSSPADSSIEAFPIYNVTSTTPTEPSQTTTAQATPARMPSPLPPAADEESAHIPHGPRSERASSISTSIIDRYKPSARQEEVANDASSPPGGSTLHLSLEDVEQVDVQIRDLRVTVDTSPSVWDPSTYPELLQQVTGKNKGQPGDHKKVLLQAVSASLGPGTLTAIIGGSGSGKTTMLNTLAERMSSPRLAVSGSAVFTSIPGDSGRGQVVGGGGSIHSVRHAYVMQQDILLPTLTVRETLRYSADLRLPPSTTAEERMRVVEEVILELGLKECADTRIGDHAHKGCSGGEKRRVSIGVQLLSNPSVLFLDEPTTGLDSTSAFQLVRTLKTLAEKGRTIITTIHQPRTEIWQLFDSLVVLTKGSPVYSGPAKDCITWFADLGFDLPPFVNPCEYFIDISAVDNRTPEVEEESTARVSRLKDAWNDESARRFADTPAQTHLTTRKTRSDARKHASFLRQVRVLTDRTFKVTYRDPMGMAASIVEVILMGICTGYIFFNLGRDQPGIRSRQGALYTSAGLQGYLFLLFEAYRLSIDIPTFDREHNEGCVDVVPFLLSRRLARLFTEDFPVPFLFSAIFYFMAGFDRDGSKFLTFFAINLLNHYIAVTCAMTCIAAIRHFPGASLIANLNYTLQSMACGYFIQSETIPVYVRWLKYITYTYYVFGSLCGNEFEGSFYDCPWSDDPNDPNCAAYVGDNIMDAFGFPTDWVWKPIVAQVAFVVFFYVLAGVGLRFFKVEMTIARARNQDDADLSFGKEKMTARSIAEVRAIDVSLENFTLSLDKRSAMGKKLPAKAILNPVTTTFQSGQINVIMGPSGSGKTSLLNAMALRLRNTVGTRYRRSGKLTFNGAEPSEAVVRSVCSYVSQDDDALLPSLTVRETLRFAAGLRLPSWMSKEEKNKRAEEVLLKMGLKDCADNLVGSDLIKGISGGEKRRVTIAIQVLTDPRVLLLDEPTSGLDAFTTLSLMELFAGLAGEGRTLILTIHQARSDLFRQFGNVLLLARGGSPVYSGPSRQMLGYFARQGYECPVHNNPADYALDLITIDLQHADREVESRRKVKALVDAWEKHVEEHRAERERQSMELDEKAAAALAVVPTRLSDIREAEESATSSEEKITAVRPVPATHSSQGIILPAPRRSFNKAKLATPAELGALVRKRAGFTTAFPILLRRAFINFRRQPPLLLARTMQVVGLGVILTLFFAPLKSDFYSVQNRAGFIQEIAAFYFIGMLQNVAVYPAERNAFYAEDDDGVYRVEAFLATYTVLELPCEILSCMLFGVLAVFAVGFPHTAELFFVCTFVCFGIVNCGESLGMMFNTLFSNHTGFAITLTSVFLSISNTMGGIMSINMPEIFKAFNYISPVRYAVLTLAPFTLRGVEFTCDDTQRLPTGQCIIATGEDVLDLYKLNVNGAHNLAYLAATAVAYRIVAWALLRAVRTKYK